MSQLKVIRVGGRSVLICGFSLFEDLRCCVAEIRWLGAAEQGELRDRSMSNPGKRNSCADTQPTSATVIFSRACSGSCPPLCENCPHPERVYGAPCKQSWCQKLHLAVAPCWLGLRFMFLQVECQRQSLFLCDGWAQISLLEYM